MATPGQRIAEARERKGLTQEQLAARLGWGQSRIGNYEAGRSAPKNEDYRLMAGELDVSAAWLAFGVHVVEEVEQPYQAQDNRYAMIPRFAVQAAAGRARAPEIETIAERLAYRRDWLERNNLNAAQCVVIDAQGDSMQPTIFDGDTILVNTADKRIANEQVYAFRHEDGPRIKRLFKQLDGRIRLVSDNPDKTQYPDEFISVDSDVAMIGRVVHRSGHV